MPMAIANSTAEPPIAMPAMLPAFRPLDPDGLGVGEVEMLLEELDGVEEFFVDAG